MPQIHKQQRIEDLKERVRAGQGRMSIAFVNLRSTDCPPAVCIDSPATCRNLWLDYRISALQHLVMQ